MRINSQPWKRQDAILRDTEESRTSAMVTFFENKTALAFSIIFLALGGTLAFIFFCTLVSRWCKKRQARVVFEASYPFHDRQIEQQFPDVTRHDEQSQHRHQHQDPEEESTGPRHQPASHTEARPGVRYFSRRAHEHNVADLKYASTVRRSTTPPSSPAPQDREATRGRRAVKYTRRSISDSWLCDHHHRVAAQRKKTARSMAGAGELDIVDITASDVQVLLPLPQTTATVAMTKHIKKHSGAANAPVASCMVGVQKPDSAHQEPKRIKRVHWKTSHPVLREGHISEAGYDVQSVELKVDTKVEEV